MPDDNTQDSQPPHWPGRRRHRAGRASPPFPGSIQELFAAIGDAIDAFNATTLYRLVRAGFIARGTTLAQWCRENGVHRSTAEQALQFQSNSPEAEALRRQLAAAAGVPWP